MKHCPKCRHAMVASLCACIAGDGFAAAQDLCWSARPRAALACTLSEAELPHIEYPDISSNQLLLGMVVVEATATATSISLRTPFLPPLTKFGT
jgi:hypothetical protein